MISSATVLPLAEHTIAAHELFFSTTDARGVIRSGNSVFVRISGYRADELAGSPHSLVRHPDMPGGVFHLLWERLRAGRQMAAYLVNLTRAGEPYWVFATITPIADGFLSVRIPPRGPLLEPVRQLYAQVRGIEAEARRAGATKSAAAAAGAAELTRRLPDLGYADYDALIDDALPVEMAARGDLLRDRFARPDATGPAGEVLAACLALDDRITGLVHHLDAYGRLTGALDATVRSVHTAADQLGNAVATARAAGEQVADTAPVLASVAEVTDRLACETTADLDALVTDLTDTRTQVADLRFRVALAALHTDMAAAFAAEVVDGGNPAGALADVALLTDTLRDSMATVALTLPEVNDRLVALGGRADAAVERFGNVRRFTGQWRSLVYRRRQGAAIGPWLDPIDVHLNESHAVLAELSHLAAACREQVVQFDLDSVQQQLGRIVTTSRSTAGTG